MKLPFKPYTKHKFCSNNSKLQEDTNSNLGIPL